MASTTTYRLPKGVAAKTPAAPTDYRNLSLSLLCVALSLGTAYSVVFNTYLDTSDPLLAHLPHPAHAHSYFARKSNVFNQIFVKKAWAWTTAAFLVVYATSPAERRTWTRVWRWAVATGVWIVFTTWFFGPALMERVMAYSGGECVIAVPSSPFISQGGAPTIMSVPLEYCHTKTTITTTEHAHLFASSLVPPPADFAGRPRLYKGHDVSGHIFLLTLAICFLTDQLTSALNPKPRIISKAHALAINSTLALLAIWWWMAIMTSVYFHTPVEKLSGFVLGVIGYFLTLIPLPTSEPPKVGAPIPNDKLRPDAMRLD